ncbi:MAG: PqqD family protein [Bacteroidota bacterium]|nr:PqqD family protein [Bacteroidota bacterium]
MSKIFYKNKDWLIRKDTSSEESYLLMNIISGDVFEINQTGKYIIELCDGTNTDAEIIGKIINADVDNINNYEKATSNDITKYLKFLIKENIIFS